MDSQCLQASSWKVFLSQIFGETSIFTLPGKVSLWQKFQIDALCGNKNMEVSPNILKSKFFFKNTWFTFPKESVWLSFVETQHNLLGILCCYKPQKQVYDNENTKICIFIRQMYIDILFSLAKAISLMFDCVTTLPNTTNMDRSLCNLLP